MSSNQREQREILYRHFMFKSMKDFYQGDGIVPLQPGAEGYDPNVHGLMQKLYDAKSNTFQHLVSFAQIRQFASALEHCYLKEGINYRTECKSLLIDYVTALQNFKNY
mmetsp:Transcript_20821/g.31014  ORF Transcript_20821/g.31014 Transcript_20821/m.31014 type:complete len:108 (+) Transcript_20821:109-432(+)